MWEGPLTLCRLLDGTASMICVQASSCCSTNSTRAGCLGKDSLYSTSTGEAGVIYGLCQVPTGHFQFSDDFVSSRPVGNSSGGGSDFLQAGVCVALHQSLLFCGEAVASGQSLYQRISQLLSMRELR